MGPTMVGPAAAMTITYDPKHAAYLDEADVRGELTRVFDVCGGCRRCLTLCTSFPSLFEMLDDLDAGVSDAGRMTPAQQDRVVDECFQCRVCRSNCPYTPDVHELAIDFPRLMARVRAMRHSTDQRAIRTMVADQVFGRTDLVGKVATRAALAINRVVGVEAGTLRRRVLALVTGVTAQRRLAPFARRGFSKSLRKRARGSGPDAEHRVTVFPTCLVEYRRPEIGHALLDVYGRHGIACEVARLGCCGAPWLTAGDTGRFTAQAARNVSALAAAIRAGTDVVVAQPTCHAVITTDYVDHVGGTDAQLVAARTFDAVAYLADHVGDHRNASNAVDARPAVAAPHIVHHEPCGRLDDVTPSPARRLLERTGATVTDVYRCTGVDGRWGLRAANERIGLAVGREVGLEIQRAAPDPAADDVVTGSCVLTNIAIEDQIERTVIHPLELLAARDLGPTGDDHDG